MERRNCIEITVEILRIASAGARKTQIVYGANLNHSLLKQYLERLEEKGLIKRERDKEERFKTTDLGHQYIEYYRNLQLLANF
ncbi:MAG: winged helix-turn-helix domain-containing protein [Nitrososphaerota archaeon]|nr:winged helix-turn-helix domain-containing protein [Candidatus Bathyarchaeota archaeon]MDW8048867.1 winged helix-turn-helix domain-containing protein [Nitrososphaerota archaeon]